MKYVLNASVAICWVIPRPLTPKADRLRNEYHRQIHELLAPAVFIDEVAGALTKAERQKDIAVGQAAPLYAKVMNSPPVLIAHAPLIARAIDISSRTRSGYYDSKCVLFLTPFFLSPWLKSHKCPTAMCRIGAGYDASGIAPVERTTSG